MALILAAGGTGYAAGKVNSAQIKDNTSKSRDVKDGALRGTDLAEGSVTGGDLGPERHRWRRGGRERLR